MITPLLSRLDNVYNTVYDKFVFTIVKLELTIVNSYQVGIAKRLTKYLCDTHSLSFWREWERPIFLLSKSLFNVKI
jgi:hypothetical protein